MQCNKFFRYAFYFFFYIIIIYSFLLITQVILFQTTDYTLNSKSIVSDLPAHIQMSTVGIKEIPSYSLLFILYKIIYNIFVNQVSVAIFVVSMIILTIFYSAKYIQKNDTKKYSIAFYLILSLFIYLEAALYIQHLNVGRYLGFFQSGVWHNSTLIAMKLCSVFLLFSLTNIFYSLNELKAIKNTDLLIFSFLCAFTTSIKPNLIFALFPALFIFIALLFLFKKDISKKLLIQLALTTIPSFLVLYIQSRILYSNTNGSLFYIKPFYLMDMWNNRFHLPSIINFIIILLQSLFFPFLVLILNFKRIKLGGGINIYSFIWIATIISIIQAILLVDQRINDGNYLWGSYNMVFLLFLISIVEFINYIRGNSFSIRSKIIVFIVCFAFIMHTYSGYKYLNYMLKNFSF